jgi:hypothetical protein
METTSITKEIPSLTNIKLKKIKLKMDSNMLDSILAFIYKDSVLRTRKSLNNIYKLFNMIDYTDYKKTPELDAKAWVIRRSLEAKAIL